MLYSSVESRGRPTDLHLRRAGNQRGPAAQPIPRPYNACDCFKCFDATSEGRTHRYHPVVKRSEAGTSALRRLTNKIFKGSPEATLTHLVSDPELTKEQLRRLKELLDDRLGGADT